MMATVKVVLDPDVRQLCRRPYYGHPKGCPNYNKREGCPPKAPLLGEVLDLSQPLTAVWAEFDLAGHREKMRRKHTGWSRRQLDCCLYWQRSVDNYLKQLVARLCVGEVLFDSTKTLRAVYCPEAFGVNVTATMESVNVKLEWPPENIVRKIALVGTPR